jgi:DNA anti-recombination protein RmuC
MPIEERIQAIEETIAEVKDDFRFLKERLEVVKDQLEDAQKDILFCLQALAAEGTINLGKPGDRLGKAAEGLSECKKELRAFLNYKIPIGGDLWMNT